MMHLATSSLPRCSERILSMYSIRNSAAKRFVPFERSLGVLD